MMKILQKMMVLAIAGVSMVGVSFAELEGWSTDLDKALEQAKKEKKSVLVEFTGSDWCPPCIAMRKNVFSKKDFITAASKNYILVEIDSPNGDKQLKKKNAPILEKYEINALPTVVLLDSEGKEFTRFSAMEHPTTEKFLDHLKASLEKKNLD